jgi:hypothetical protein
MLGHVAPVKDKFPVVVVQASVINFVNNFLPKDVWGDGSIVIKDNGKNGWGNC